MSSNGKSLPHRGIVDKSTSRQNPAEFDSSMLNLEALNMADLAFCEANLPVSNKTRAAIYGYLWARLNIEHNPGGDVIISPSLNTLRSALLDAGFDLIHRPVPEEIQNPLGWG
jgi:hypothetical protein